MTAAKATHRIHFPVRHRYAVNLERRPAAISIKEPPSKSVSISNTMPRNAHPSLLPLFSGVERLAVPNNDQVLATEVDATV
jgi:hypothetical protein